MMIWIAIAAGGATGAVARYATTLGVAAAMGPGWHPVATLSVNVIGSGLMGLFYGLIQSGLINVNDAMRVFVQIGFLGALTTFSSFALDAAGLFEKGQINLILAYVLASVLLSLAAFAVMLWVVRMLAAGQ